MKLKNKMKFNEKDIKTWSLIGQRATFGLMALELVKKNNNFIILTSDVSTSAGLDRFRKTFPSNYVDVGIAEQNLIGVASGLASENFKVFTTTFAPFQTLRCCEQIKVNLGYMKKNVTMVGLASGLALGPLGFTHACIEDVGVIRSIPNITIISPADCFELVKTLEALMNYEKPCYVRVTGGSNNPRVYNSDYKFEIGKSVELKSGNEFTLFCTGPTVYNCLEAAKILEEKNVSVSVVNIHTIKPIDEKIILEKIKINKNIFTVEEHNIVGGLGSAVAEVMSSNFNNCKLIRLGIDDLYPRGGSQKYLQDLYGLSIDKIVYKVLKQKEIL
jgi:transketolase